MNKNNGREITIEDLAQMVAKGFESIDRRFGVIDTQLATMRNEIREVRNEVGEVRQDISTLDSKFVARKEFNELLLKLKFG